MGYRNNHNGGDHDESESSSSSDEKSSPSDSNNHFDYTQTNDEELHREMMIQQQHQQQQQQQQRPAGGGGTQKLNKYYSHQQDETQQYESGNGAERIRKLFDQTKDINRRMTEASQSTKMQHYQDGYGSQQHFNQQPELYEEIETKESLKFIETKLSKARDTNVNLGKKLEEAQEEIDRCHDQIARQANHNHNLEIQLEKQLHEIEDLASSHQDLIQRSGEESANYERRLDYLNEELQRMKKQTQLKEEGVKSLQIANDQYKDKCYQLEAEIASRIEDMDVLRQELRRKEDQLDQTYLNRGLDTTFKLELDSVKEDNQRLLKLLKQTNEYKNFSNYIDDSGGAVRNVADKENIKGAAQQKIDVNIDDEQWAPAEAYNLAHQFRQKHGNELTPTLINQLLADLNKIWREREKKQLARMKQQCQNEILVLKRQLNHRATFDEVTAKKNLSRLKGKLTNARQEIQKTQALKEKQKVAPVGVELIDNTLQIVQAMQVQRKTLEDENFALKERVEKLEKIRQSQEYEKSKYMEGAVWMGKRVANEIEKVCYTIDNLIQEYHIRSKDPSPSRHQLQPSSSFGLKGSNDVNDIYGFQRTSQWFLEVVKQASFDLYEKCTNMLESAVYNMEEAQNRLDEILFNNKTNTEQYKNTSQKQSNQLLPSYSKKTSQIGGDSSEMYDPESMFRATGNFNISS